jgi:uncharacterized protein (DUF4415 family)
MRTAAAATGIPGLLDQLLSPNTSTTPARTQPQKTPKIQGSLPSPCQAEERPTTKLLGARRGRPPGPPSFPAETRQKVTLRLPADLIAAYRDWSWEARSQLSYLVERALVDYRASHRQRV